jgi:hypothetical protein
MRLTIIVALVALSLLPATAYAQTNPQTAAAEGASSPTPTTTAPAMTTPTPSGAGGITREQYLQHAQERAGQRAGAHFDQMDTNHDGVLDRAEIRAWRSQHPRRATAQPTQTAPQ